jgi:hypothetical protein
MESNKSFSDEKFQIFFKENINLLRNKKQIILMMGDKLPLIEYANKFIIRNSKEKINELLTLEIHNNYSQITIIESHESENIKLESEHELNLSFQNISELQNHFYKQMTKKDQKKGIFNFFF